MPARETTGDLATILGHAAKIAQHAHSANEHYANGPENESATAKVKHIIQGAERTIAVAVAIGAGVEATRQIIIRRRQSQKQLHD